MEDEQIRKFILDKTAAPYFSNIVWYIRDTCYTLDSLVINSTHTNKARLEDFIAELLDFFFYLQDIFNLHIDSMSEVLSEHLLQCLLVPQFIGSLSSDIELEVLIKIHSSWFFPLGSTESISSCIFTCSNLLYIQPQTISQLPGGYHHRKHQCDIIQKFFSPLSSYI